MHAWLNLPTALALLALLSAPVRVAAQDEPQPSGPPPVTIAYAEGRVDISRGAGVEPVQTPDLVDEGDRLVTVDGRAELVQADGTVIHVDRDTDLYLDSGSRWRLVRGHVIVRTSAADNAVTIATPSGPVRLEPRGEYDIAARDLDGDTIVATMRGDATLLLAQSDIPVRPDDVLLLDPRDLRPRWQRWHGRPSLFAEWAADRMNAVDRAVRAQPLPPELSPYAPALAAHGYWGTVAPYGPVWYPRVAGWRPYDRGSWRHTRYGWTWIDSDAWAWPVHHFGRWGRQGAGAWYWIPQRTWGPAWVGWAVEANHVGWSPLGWNSRPVVDFFAGARIGPTDLWASSWSIVPRHAFGRRGPIGGPAYDLRRLPGPVLGGFVTQSRGPRGPEGNTGWGPRAQSGDRPRRVEARGDGRSERVVMPAEPGAGRRAVPRNGAGARTSDAAAAGARVWRQPSAVPSPHTPVDSPRSQPVTRPRGDSGNGWGSRNRVDPVRGPSGRRPSDAAPPSGPASGPEWRSRTGSGSESRSGAGAQPGEGTASGGRAGPRADHTPPDARRDRSSTRPGDRRSGGGDDDRARGDSVRSRPSAPATPGARSRDAGSAPERRGASARPSGRAAAPAGGSAQGQGERRRPR